MTVAADDEAPVPMEVLRSAVAQRGDRPERSGAGGHARVGRWPYLACPDDAALGLTHGTCQREAAAEDRRADERGGRP